MLSYAEAQQRVFACGVLHYEGGQSALVQFSLDDAGNVLTVTDAGYIRLGVRAKNAQDALSQLSQRDDVTGLTSKGSANA